MQFLEKFMPLKNSVLQRISEKFESRVYALTAAGGRHLESTCITFWDF